MFVWPNIQLSCGLPGPKFVSCLFSVDSYQLRVLLNLLTVGLIVSLYKINECIVSIIQILNF